MSDLPQPKGPNILITGVPGTGKTTMSEMLAEETGMRHINVGDVVKDKACHDGFDQEHDAFTLNEDKLCDELEDLMVQGGNIVDFHTCDFFPERWFHLVVVLRADNTKLYNRLEKRGYTQEKISENVEAEIMQVVLDDAKGAFDDKIVLELTSDQPEEMEENVEKLAEWAAAQKKRFSRKS